MEGVTLEKAIEMLEAAHPVKNGLNIGATTEQRAHYQIQTQTYESILQNLRKLRDGNSGVNFESTYTETEDKENE